MPDHAAQAVVKRFWGDMTSIETTVAKAPIERYLEYKRLNDVGWPRVIAAQGPEEAEKYRTAMKELGKQLGLE